MLISEFVMTIFTFRHLLPPPVGMILEHVILEEFRSWLREEKDILDRDKIYGLG